MKLHEFHKKFANKSLSDRMKLLNINTLGTMCLLDVDKEIRKLDKIIDEARIKQNELLKKVENLI